MTDAEFALWFLNVLIVGFVGLVTAFITMFLMTIVGDWYAGRKMKTFISPLAGYPRERYNFRSIPVPKIGDVLKFTRLGMELGYAVVAVAREPIPPFKNYWERTFESKWQRDVFIFLGVAEKWTDQAGSRWYGIVLRARDEKVLVFPDYCFEPCHPN